MLSTQKMEKTMSKANKIVYFFISIIFFMAFDLYFSALILDSLRFKIEENPILDLIFVQNTGAAFSISENSQIFLIGFSIVAMLLILNYIIRNSEKFSVFALYWAAMLTAGIGCNLYERIAFFISEINN